MDVNFEIIAIHEVKEIDHYYKGKKTYFLEVFATTICKGVVCQDTWPVNNYLDLAEIKKQGFFTGWTE